jgi:1,4-dihydroxy-2-naphthoate polyprenyltransferase
MNVLVINGHPRKDSFITALTHAYTRGAEASGAVIKTLVVADLSFEPNVTHSTPHLQYLEPCIQMAQRWITWAHHIVFIYPTWWGTMPALLKAFLDRVLTSGFAFDEIEGGTGYAPLLRGKSAQLITTMDTPVLVYKLIYRAPGHNAMRRATLGFCGFEMAKTISLGPVKKSTAQKRETWLQIAEKEGKRLRRGSLSRWKMLRIRAAIWFKAIRFQFYPMTFIAYATGSLLTAGRFDPFLFWIGYAWLFFLELATVLINDYVDYESDMQNRFFGPFTGGSRVIVERQLSFRQVRNGVIGSLLISLAFLTTILVQLQGNMLQTALACGGLTILALGYTAPPLKLCYHRLGELTVGITHSVAVVVCGYLFQHGDATNPAPWLMSLPLFLSVLPSITLAGIPDREADKAVSKKTMAVTFGKKGAAIIAMLCTVLAASAVVTYEVMNVLPGIFANILYFVLPHATLLVYLLYKYYKNKSGSARIDGLLVAALTYLVWFAVIPLLNLM